MEDTESSRTIARLSVAYVIGIVSEALRTTSLDPLDVLIAMTVANSNVLHLTRPSETSRRHAHADRPAPDGIKRGISRNAISRTLNVPLETVRRRVGVLLTKGVLHERADGLFMLDANPLGGLDSNARFLALNAQLVRQLYRNLRAHDVKLD
jgi:hypothetical protein